METRVAVISIIVENPEATEQLNQYLHESGKYIIGRMGIPYRQKGIHIISIAIDAPQDVISALSGKLGAPRKKHLRLYVILFITVGKFGNIFYGILSAIHNDLSVNKTSHKYLSIRGSVAYLLSLGTILSIPPIYFLRTSGIFTLPSAQRLFSRNAISILGGAPTVLLRVCAK